MEKERKMRSKRYKERDKVEEGEMKEKESKMRSKS
jgi:hypothetical protein